MIKSKNIIILLVLINCAIFIFGCSGGSVQDISGMSPYTAPTATPYPTPSGPISPTIDAFCRSTYEEGHIAHTMNSLYSQNSARQNFRKLRAQCLLYVQTVSVPIEWEINSMYQGITGVLLKVGPNNASAFLEVGGIETTSTAGEYYNTFITNLINSGKISNYQLTGHFTDGNKQTWVYTATRDYQASNETYIANQTLAPSGKFLLDTAHLACSENIFNDYYPTLAACADTREITPQPGYEILTASNLAINFDLSFYTSPSYRFNAAVYDRVNEAWGDFINQ